MSRLPPRLPCGYRLVFRDTVESTNDEAKELARAGAGEGVVVWALQQTAGRGRRGRRWWSPPGNLYATFVLRADCPAARMPQLGFVAALAVAAALRTAVPAAARVSCKWPNDVLLDGRKVAGILVESEIGAGGVPAVLVVGIGINLAAAPSDASIEATCVAAALGEAPAPAAMLEALAAAWHAWLGRWRAAGFAPIRGSWLKDAAGLGRPIRVRLSGADLAGRFCGIDAEGALLLDTADGMRRVSAGEVFPAAS